MKETLKKESMKYFREYNDKYNLGIKRFSEKKIFFGQQAGNGILFINYFTRDIQIYMEWNILEGKPRYITYFER